MPYPSLLHPEPLPLWQATGDPYLIQETLKHSSVSVSVGSLSPGVHKACLSPLSISVRYGVDSKNDFALTILLGLLLCPWNWGIPSNLLQCHAALAPGPTILLGILCPWTDQNSPKALHCFFSVQTCLMFCQQTLDTFFSWTVSIVPSIQEVLWALCPSLKPGDPPKALTWGSSMDHYVHWPPTLRDHCASFPGVQCFGNLCFIHLALFFGFRPEGISSPSYYNHDEKFNSLLIFF